MVLKCNFDCKDFVLKRFSRTEDGDWTRLQFVQFKKLGLGVEFQEKFPEHMNSEKCKEKILMNWALPTRLIQDALNL